MDFKIDVKTKIKCETGIKTEILDHELKESDNYYNINEETNLNYKSESFETCIKEENNEIDQKLHGLGMDYKLQELEHYNIDEELNLDYKFDIDEINQENKEFEEELQEVVIGFEEKKYKHEVSKKLISSESSLIDSMVCISHCGISERKHKCGICEKTFATIFNLKRHSLGHSDETNYKCTICEKMFVTKEQLREHLCFHSSENNKCKICSWPFSCLRSLYKHEKLHTQMRWCTICEKMFSSSNQLKRHKLIHNDKKNNFHCTLCNKTFSRKGNLKLHSVVHSNERRFPCTICTKSFSHEGYLNKHLHLHNW